MPTEPPLGSPNSNSQHTGQRTTSRVSSRSWPPAQSARQPSPGPVAVDGDAVRADERRGSVGGRLVHRHARNGAARADGQPGVLLSGSGRVAYVRKGCGLCVSRFAPGAPGKRCRLGERLRGGAPLSVDVGRAIPSHGPCRVRLEDAGLDLSPPGRRSPRGVRLTVAASAVGIPDGPRRGTTKNRATPTPTSNEPVSRSRTNHGAHSAAAST